MHDLRFDIGGKLPAERDAGEATTPMVQQTMVETGSLLITLLQAMRLFHRCILAAAAVFVAGTSEGQQPMVRFLGAAEQVPTSGVYRAACDTAGALWFCTDAGVFRYDGHAFDPVPLVGGGRLSDAIVSVFRHPVNGELWFGDYGCGLFQQDGGALRPVPMRWQEEPSETCKLRSLAFLSGGSMLLGFDQGAGSAELAPGSGQVMPRSAPPGVLMEEIDGQWLLSSGPQDQDSLHVTVVRNAGTRRWSLPVTGAHQARNNHKMLLLANGDILLTEGNRMVLFNSNGVLREHVFKRPIARMLQDGKGRIWVAENKVGLHVLDDQLRDLGWRFPELSGADLTDITFDRQGCIWVTALDKGIAVIAEPEWSQMDLLRDLRTTRVNAMVSDGSGGLLIGTVEGHLLRLASDGSVLSTWRSEEGEGTTEIRGMRAMEEGVFVGTSGRSFHWEAGAVEPIRWPVRTNAAFDALPLGNGRHLVLNIAGVHEVNASGQVIATELDRIRCYKAVTFRDTLWCATENGLYRRTQRGFELEPWFAAKGKLPVADLAVWNGRLWAATQGAGLLLRFGDAWRGVDENLRLDMCASLSVQNDSALWVGTRGGLLRVGARGGQWTTTIVPDARLGSDRVRRVLCTAHALWAATDRALVRIPWTHGDVRWRVPAPRIELLPLVGHEKVGPSEFQEEHGGIRLRINAPLPLSGKGERYRYQLIGRQPVPVEVASPVVELPGLAAGRYLLEVAQRGADGQWSPAARTAFSIRPVFWRRWWFILLCVLLGMAAVGATMGFVIRRMKRMKAMEERLNAYHQEVLLNQMDPHFIFNALNSIQAFVVRNDARNSARYLATFSGHMRDQLEASFKRSVTLAEEIKLLNDYCMLESLRSSPRFEWSVMVGDGIDAETVRLPSLLLQPYVENAVRHGVLPLQGMRIGRVDIGFSANNGELLCIVEDNGVGRAGSKAPLVVGKKPSRGLEITRGRLRLLGRAFGRSSFTERVLDLNDELGAAIGTRVEVRIPLGLCSEDFQTANKEEA